MSTPTVDDNNVLNKDAETMAETVGEGGPQVESRGTAGDAATPPSSTTKIGSSLDASSPFDDDDGAEGWPDLDLDLPSETESVHGGEEDKTPQAQHQPSAIVSVTAPDSSTVGDTTPTGRTPTGSDFPERTAESANPNTALDVTKTSSLAVEPALSDVGSNDGINWGFDDMDDLLKHESGPFQRPEGLKVEDHAFDDFRAQAPIHSATFPVVPNAQGGEEVADDRELFGAPDGSFDALEEPVAHADAGLIESLLAQAKTEDEPGKRERPADIDTNQTYQQFGGVSSITNTDNVETPRAEPDMFSGVEPNSADSDFFSRQNSGYEPVNMGSEATPFSVEDADTRFGEGLPLLPRQDINSDSLGSKVEEADSTPQVESTTEIEAAADVAAGTTEPQSHSNETSPLLVDDNAPTPTPLVRKSTQQVMAEAEGIESTSTPTVESTQEPIVEEEEVVEPPKVEQPEVKTPTRASLPPPGTVGAQVGLFEKLGSRNNSATDLAAGAQEESRTKTPTPEPVYQKLAHEEPSATPAPEEPVKEESTPEEPQSAPFQEDDAGSSLFDQIGTTHVPSGPTHSAPVHEEPIHDEPALEPLSRSEDTQTVTATTPFDDVTDNTQTSFFDQIGSGNDSEPESTPIIEKEEPTVNPNSFFGQIVAPVAQLAEVVQEKVQEAVESVKEEAGLLLENVGAPATGAEEEDEPQKEGDDVKSPLEEHEGSSFFDNVSALAQEEKQDEAASFFDNVLGPAQEIGEEGNVKSPFEEKDEAPSLFDNVAPAASDDFFASIGGSSEPTKTGAASAEAPKEEAKKEEDVEAKWKALFGESDSEDSFLDDTSEYLPSDEEATGVSTPQVQQPQTAPQQPLPHNQPVNKYASQALQAPPPARPQLQTSVYGSSTATMVPAQSFVDKKTSYQSPYDLPEDLAPVVRKKPSTIGGHAGPYGAHGGIASPISPMPPIRTSSMGPGSPFGVPPPPPGAPAALNPYAPALRTGPMSRPGTATSTKTPATPATKAAFFEELPMVTKPKAAPRYAPTTPLPGVQGPPRPGSVGTYNQFASPPASFAPPQAAYATPPPPTGVTQQGAYATPPPVVVPPMQPPVQQSTYMPPPAPAGTPSKYAPPQPGAATSIYSSPPGVAGAAAPPPPQGNYGTSPAAPLAAGLGVPGAGIPRSKSPYAPPPAAGITRAKSPYAPAPAAQPQSYSAPPQPTNAYAAPPKPVGGLASPPSFAQPQNQPERALPPPQGANGLQYTPPSKPPIQRSHTGPYSSPPRATGGHGLDPHNMHSSRPSTSLGQARPGELGITREEDEFQAESQAQSIGMTIPPPSSTARSTYGSSPPLSPPTSNGFQMGSSPARYAPSNLAQRQLSGHIAQRSASPEQFSPPKRSQTQSPASMASGPFRKEPFRRPTSAFSNAHPAQQQEPRQTTAPINFLPPTNPLTAQDPLQRWQGAPMLAWNLGGSVAATFPMRIPRYTADSKVPLMKCSPGEVKVKQIKDIIPLDEAISTFPGPLVNGAKSSAKAHKKDVVTWVNARIQEWEKEESNEDEHKERILLWKVVGLLVENDGILEGTPEIEKAVRAVLWPEGNSKEEGEFATGYSTLQAPVNSSIHQGKETYSAADVAEIRDKLLQGDRTGAVWLAADKKLWSHAFLISSTVNQDLWKQVVQDFIKNEVKTLGSGNESLAVLYEIFAGNAAESVDELVPPSTRMGITMATQNAHLVQDPLQGLSKWRETLTIILSNRSNGDVEAIKSLGKLLASYGRISAAHICFIFARSISVFSGLDDANVDYSLLGVDHVKYPQTYSKEIYSILLTEIYEMALALPATAPNPGIPHLQTLKLHHAHILAQHGLIGEAQKYCEAISQILRATTTRNPYYQPPLFAALEDLTQRLLQSPKDVTGSWLSKPSLDNISSGLWGTFHKFVAGEEEDDKLATKDEGAFSRVTPSPGISRVQSQVDMYGGMNAYAGTVGPAGGAYNPNPVAAKSMYNPRSSSESQRYNPASMRTSLDKPRTSYDAPAVNGGYGGYDPNPYGGAQGGYDGYGSSSHQATPLATARQSLDQSRKSFDSPLRNSFDPTSASMPQQGQPQEQYGGYQPDTGYGAPDQGYTPYQPDEPEEEKEEEKPKKKKGFFDDDDDDELVKKAAKLKEEEEKRKAEEKKKEEEEKAKAAGKGGWLSGWFRKKEGDAPKVHKAKLGEESTFYYDKELKRWVNKNAPADTAAATGTPPPPRAMGTPATSTPAAGTPQPSRPPSSMGQTSSGLAPPPIASSPLSDGPPRPPLNPATSAPPPSTGVKPPPSPSPLALGSKPPPSPRPTSAMSGMLSPPPTATPPPPPASAPPIKPANGGGDDLMDQLLGAPGTGRRAPKKKKGGRYVDVLKQ